MKLIRRVFLLTVFLGLAAGVALAQQARIDIDAVKVTPATAGRGQTVVIDVTLTPHDGWHLYGQLEETGPPPKIELTASTLAAVAPTDVPLGDEHESFGMKSYWIVGQMTLSRKYKIPADAPLGDMALEGVIKYMACTAESCDPEHEVGFKTKVAVSDEPAPAGGEPEGAGPTPNPTAWTPLPHEGHASIKVRFSHGSVGRGSVIALEFDIEPDFDWHIYGKKEKTGPPPKVVVTNAAALGSSVRLIGELEVPDGERHESFGIESYWIAEPTTVRQRIGVLKDAPVGLVAVEGTISYMACTSETCDEVVVVPFKTKFDIDAAAPIIGRVVAAGDQPPAAKSGQEKGAGSSKPTKTAATDTGDERLSSIWILILEAIGAGLFALAMPCTYPMIPITISFFTKQADARGGKVLPLAVTYGLGIIVIFILIGLSVGSAIVPFATHPITNVVIGVLFLVFGLSLFGLINLQPPQFLMQFASKASSRGGYVGVFLMGMTLVITSFTCTAPFIGLVLASGATLGAGGIALGMGVFGATMAIPFVFLSLVPGKLKAMPKSGSWMNTLKVSLGFIEVAAALKFFSNAEYVWQWNILPRELFLTIWAGTFFCAGLFLFGMIKLKGETGDIGPGRLTVAIATMLLAFYFFHGSLGYKLDNNIMIAFEPPYTSARIGDFGSGGGTKKKRAPEIIKDDFDRAVEVAKASGKKLLINFTGFT